MDASEGDGGRALDARLYAPAGLGVDSTGNLFIADPDNHRIRRVSPTGVITTVAGTGIAGSWTSDTAVSQPLNRPLGVAVTSSGVHIADTGNGRVRTVTPDGAIEAGRELTETRYIRAGSGGNYYLILHEPHGIAVDESANVYVASRLYGAILRVDPRVRFVTIASGLNQPTGLARDRFGNLYIAETGNHRILKLTPQGTLIPVAGVQRSVGGPRARVSPTLTAPEAVALDAQGNLYIADTGNHRIQKQTPDGSVTTVAGRGAPGFDGDGGPAASALLRSPKGLAVDEAGNLYIADTGNARIRKVSPTGVITTVAGIGKAYLGSDNGPADQALLHFPRGLAADAESNLYIADTGSSRIVHVSPDRRMETVAGAGDAGFGGDGGPASLALLNQPQAVAVDGPGNLYVADMANHRIRRVSTGGIITTVAGSGREGFAGDGGPATAARLAWPMGVAVDAAGNVYIADTGNRRIRQVRADGVITTVAGGGLGYVEIEGPMPGTSARLYSPRALHLDARGNLYIAESNWIGKLTSDGLLESVAGGLPCCAWVNGDGGAATSAQLWQPEGLTMDHLRNLYIAETGNHRVRKITVGGMIWTLAGTGTDFNFRNQGRPPENAPAAMAPLQRPSGVAIDRNGTLYIADVANHRIREVPEASSCTREGPPAIGSVDNLVVGGKVLSIFGVNLGPAEGTPGVFDSSERLETSLAGTKVLFDDEPAPLLYAQYHQVNVVVPASVVWTGIHQAVTIAVEREGERSTGIGVGVVQAIPALFTTESFGRGQALALNQDGRRNSASNPAPKASIVTLFATGEGPTEPPREDGRPASEPLPRPVLRVSVSFRALLGPIATELIDAHAAPGLIGVMQVKFRIPQDAPSGPAVPITLAVGGAQSQRGVTIAVR